ncbi:hypothetical protein BDF19DRAFT_423385 [Syncephalis fuscata]|nr:hypothetical protein BDF19DRAFT_423385 [Syncephalis fuscata]
MDGIITTLGDLPPNCELLQLVQYRCEYKRRSVICRPIARYFERCAGQPTREIVPIKSNTITPSSTSSTSLK